MTSQIEVLRECAATFRRYEQLHVAKNTDEGREKAAANAAMADRCEKALAAAAVTKEQREAMDDDELARHYLGRFAPVQGLTGGIPWTMHLRAYDVYVKRYGKQRAMIDLDGHGCRGGFHSGELDSFIPGWREELERHRSESDALRRTIDALDTIEMIWAEEIMAYPTGEKHKKCTNCLGLDGTHKPGCPLEVLASFPASAAEPGREA